LWTATSKSNSKSKRRHPNCKHKYVDITYQPALCMYPRLLYVGYHLTPAGAVRWGQLK
jgi:hypothetical protein